MALLRLLVMFWGSPAAPKQGPLSDPENGHDEMQRTVLTWMMPRLAQPELPIRVPALSTKTDPKKRRQRKVTNRCRVVLIFGTRSVFGPTFSQVFGLQFFAGWLVFFCWRVAFCGHFWSQFLVPFLVPVFGTGLPPNTRIVIQPQTSGPSFGHPFWSPNLGPKTVQFSVPNSGHISTQF